MIWFMLVGDHKHSKDEPSVGSLDRGSTSKGKASPGDDVPGVPAKDGVEHEKREPMKVIKANPSATPMFTFLNNHSKCGAKKPEVRNGEPDMGSVELVRMSSLMRSMKESGRNPLPPKGFVYHETRCGSTLVANMLASLPPSRVFSESKPPTQTIRECYADGCSRDMMLSIFRNVVALMGRRREGEKHEHLYFKFQNSKFIPEISEAFPEVPWIFVFRDPVEVMVSNLKSFSGAPCVRIPRQEKMRKAGGGQGGGKKVAMPNFVAGGKLNVPGGHVGGGGRLPPGRRWLREEGGDGVASPGSDGTVKHVLQEFVSEMEKYIPEEELSSFATVSWNGFSDGGDWDDHYNYNSSMGFQEMSAMALSSGRDGGGREKKERRLAEKRLTKQLKLSMNMTMECADWLMSLCASAVEGGQNFPNKALFVDYANLPDAVPEYVFPKHFAMEPEVGKAVPDWEERMWKAAGSYSKGGGKTGRVFAGDIEAKHKQASPLIVEASGLEGGLYEIYHTLDGMQTWRRPNVTNGSE